MKVIDEEKMAGLKVVDINNPPTKDVPRQEFPKALYLHPKDKTKEHLVKIVANAEEQKAAMAAGWKTTPHAPLIPTEEESGDYETAAAELQPAAGEKRHRG